MTFASILRLYGLVVEGRECQIDQEGLDTLSNSRETNS